MKNRLGIFVIHDDKGEVKDYVIYLLETIGRFFTDLVIVSNGFLLENAQKKLEHYTKKILIRANEGYDVTAFKEAQINYIGWEKIKEYDELILINDSCYGPLYSFDTIYKIMENVSCDFWGISEQKECLCPKEVYGMDRMPRHIQSYFLLIRKSMIRSKYYREFWEQMEQINTYFEAVVKYELQFTKYFESFGYKGCSYMEIVSNGKIIFPDIMRLTYECVKDYSLPFVKRKSFILSEEDKLRFSIAEESRKTLEYISKYTEYDVNLIWQDLIAKCEPKQLIDSLKMQYVIPHKVRKNGEVLQKKVAVLIHLYYEDEVDTCFEYIKEIPKEIDVYITTSKDNMLDRIQKKIIKNHLNNIVRLQKIANRGREIRGLLVENRDLFFQYEYICFLHDKKTSLNRGSAKIGKSFMYLLWENLLKNQNYINNVIQFMEERPYLGLLVPIAPYHASYFSWYGREWTSCYKTTEQLAKRLSLNCIMSKNVPPPTIGTGFWCKTDALKTLVSYEWQENDFPTEPMPEDNTLNHAIERIFAYVAQHEGYATGMVMTKEFASINYSNYFYMLRTIIPKEKEDIFFETYSEAIEKEERDKKGIDSFIVNYKDIYIYGIGEYATVLQEYVRNRTNKLIGFIVSDGHKKQEMYMGKKVYELSEIIPNKEEGIIVALNFFNSAEVLPQLLKRGFKNIYIDGKKI